MKRFDEWNSIKKRVEEQPPSFFHEREIFLCKLGENVGFEQSGQGSDFVRPVLVFRKFNNNFFWGIPLSKTQNRGRFYYSFSFIDGIESVALLSQMKPVDAKRLLNKIGMIKKDDYFELNKKISDLVKADS
jgi:mRNA interferase MazF